MLCITLKITFSQTASTRILIDPDNLFGGNVSDIFSGLSYVPLENSKAFLLDDIAAIRVGDNFIYIYDRIKDQILIFDLKGNFKNKITKYPDKIFSKNWNGFSDLYYDEYRKTLLVVGSLRNADAVLLEYDEAGNYNHKYQSLPFTFFKLSDKNNLVEFNSYNTTNREKSETFHVRFWRDGIRVKSYLPIDQDVLMRGMDNMMDYAYGYDFDNNNMLFSKAGEYNIYSLNEDSITNVYQVLFPFEYSLPIDLFTNKMNEGKRFESLADRPNMFYWLSRSPIFKYKSKLFFSPLARSMSERVMYDFDSETGYSLKRISSELGDLPICGSRGILEIKNGKAYSFITAYEFLKLAPTDISILPPNIQQFITRNNDLANPILIILDLDKHD